MKKHPKLIITDLDNTNLCWFKYFAHSTKKSILLASEITKIPYEQLCDEFKQVIDREDNIEYPFAIQLLPSIMKHYDFDVKKILSECANPARSIFKLEAYPYLKPYDNVLRTIQKIKTEYPTTKLVILTDAPLQLAIARLHKMSILNYFDGVYGLENSKIPLIKNEVAVSQDLLLKNLDKWRYGFIGKARELPNDYRKPSPNGFKNILLDFNLEQYEKSDIVYIGDNVHRDILLANQMKTTSCLAAYGLKVDPQLVKTIREFIPERFIHKGLDLSKEHPRPDHICEDFSDLLKILENL
jgi:FMN phosphatase YigB (HAD superfamily)